MQPTFEAGEWRRVLWLALVVTFLTTLPYLIGWWMADDEWIFNGFVFAVDDGNAYLGKMRIGVEGGWEFYLFFTPEDHESAAGLYLPYILIGHLVRILVDPAPHEIAPTLAIAFQLLRIAATLITVLVIYRFIAVFVADRGRRWLALLIAIFGGGLGWLLLLFGAIPPEFFIPEGFTLLVLLGLPHIALGRSALLGGFITLLTALDRHSWRDAVWSGLLWNIIGLMVTFYLAVLYALLAAWGLALWIRERRFPRQYAAMSALAAGLTLPQFLYSAWLFTQHEAFAQWSAQNYLPSPPPLHYLAAYSLLIFLAFFGVRVARHQLDHRRLTLLVSWVLIVPILVYLPLNVQRRLSEGVLIPLSILAVMGDQWLLNSDQLRADYRRGRSLLLALLFVASLLLWILITLQMFSQSLPIYRPAAEVAAMDALEQITDEQIADEDAVVMSSMTTGNYLPIRTGLRPFLGHGPETLDSTEKQAIVRAFYRGHLSPQERADLFATYGIDYVMWGSQERAIAGWGRIIPDWTEELEVIYDQDGYVIYRAGNVSR